MHYRPYQHVEKIGTTATDGILNGTVYLSYKIDGTNGCVYLSDDCQSLSFGSRRAELSFVDDNRGFVAMMTNDKTTYDNLKCYLTRYPDRIIYGEWLVPVTIKRYKEDAWKHFYIFDIFDTTTGRYVNYDDYKDDLDMLGLKYIPIIAKLINPTFDDVKSYFDKTGDFLIASGLGEGIVIKNYDFVNRDGKQIWAKALVEDFYGEKKKIRTQNHENKIEHLTEHKIVQKFLTPEFVHKEFSKFKEIKGDWRSSYIGEFLNYIFIEFYRDNWELILKSFKVLVIDFNILRRIVSQEVKNVLNNFNE